MGPETLTPLSRQALDHGDLSRFKWQQVPSDAIPMHFGDMDFDPDPEIVDALSRRLVSPLTYPAPYTSNHVGRAISQYYKRAHALDLEPRNLVLGASSLSQTYQVLEYLAGPGDEVLYWAPAFKHIPEAIVATGATAVAVPIAGAGDLSSFITPKTRAIYLVNPHNPTGLVYTRAELTHIALVAARNGLTVFAHELHERVIFEGLHTTFATVAQEEGALSITLSGPSKSHNLAALGGSFCFSTAEDLIDGFRNATRHRYPEASDLQQQAMHAAYSHDSPWLVSTRDRLLRNRNYLRDTLATGLPNLQPPSAAATQFTWIDFSPCLKRAESATSALLNRCRIVAACGTEFGASAEWARLTFSLHEGDIVRAAERIVSGLS